MKEKVFKSAAVALVIALGLGSAEALASGFQHRGHGLHGRNGFIQGHKSHRSLIPILGFISTEGSIQGTSEVSSQGAS